MFVDDKIKSKEYRITSSKSCQATENKKKGLSKLKFKMTPTKINDRNLIMSDSYSVNFLMAHLNKTLIIIIFNFKHLELPTCSKEEEKETKQKGKDVIPDSRT